MTQPLDPLSESLADWLPRPMRAAEGNHHDGLTSCLLDRDSHDGEFRGGGVIPGLPDVPAYGVRLDDPAPLPVVLAAPHGGRAYPLCLVAAMRSPEAALRLEDRLIDRVALAVARETGAGLIVAQAPRAMIDLNRAPDDVDWDMVAHAPASPVSRSGAVRRARSGLGLVPRRLPGTGEVWRGRLAHDDLQARIEGVHVPYHAVLAAMLDRVASCWGAALLIDLHSMPPLPAPAPGELAARYVVGDRFGAACDGAIIGSVFAYLGARGCLASHNRPYAGGYGVERHARKREGVHVLQLEIDRQCYLEDSQRLPGPGYEPTIALLSGLVRQVAADVAALGRERLRWRAAAE